MVKQRLPVTRQTHPLIWLLAILCTILAIAVIITGLVIFIGYMIIRPKAPYIHTTYVHLDNLSFDQSGQLETQMTLVLEAVNDNSKVHSSFSDVGLVLRFKDVPLARLEAAPFDVPKNSTLPLPYLIHSSVPLETRQMDEIELSLKRNKISFNLKGDARTRWKVGFIGFVKFWTHMSCELEFFVNNGSSINYYCSSKSD